MQTVDQVLMILQSAIWRVDVSVIRNVIAHINLGNDVRVIFYAIYNLNSTTYLRAVEDRTETYYINT